MDITLKNGTIIRERTKFNPFKIRTYLSVCIRFFDRTEYNHVAIVLYIGNEPYVFEAWKCVRLTKLSHWIRPENKYEFISPDADFDAEYALAKAMDMLGWVEYNYLGTMFFQLIYQLFGVWIGPTGDKANKKVQCAQCLGIILKMAEEWLLSPISFKPKQ